MDRYSCVTHELTCNNTLDSITINKLDPVSLREVHTRQPFPSLGWLSFGPSVCQSPDLPVGSRLQWSVILSSRPSTSVLVSDTPLSTLSSFFTKVMVARFLRYRTLSPRPKSILGEILERRSSVWTSLRLDCGAENSIEGYVSPTPSSFKWTSEREGCTLVVGETEGIGEGGGGRSSDSTL